MFTRDKKKSSAQINWSGKFLDIQNKNEKFEIKKKSNYRVFYETMALFINKLLGIPINQQHLLYQQTELNDSIVLKDIPVFEGMRLKLVLGMKVGPIQSARRVLPSLSDYGDSWFDINDVMQNSK